MPGYENRGAEKRRLAFEFRGGAELQRIRDFVLTELESRGIVSVDKTLNDLGSGDHPEIRTGTGPEPFATLTLEWDSHEQPQRPEPGVMSHASGSDAMSDIDHSAIAREGAITQRSESRVGDPSQWDDRVRVISSQQPARRSSHRSHGSQQEEEPPDEESIWKETAFAPYDKWPPRGTMAYWRMWLHFTMEKESYSSLALVVFTIVMFLILISTLAYCLQTIPSFTHLPVWKYLESVVSIAFTVELFLRCIACRNAWKFWKCGTFYFYSFLNFVDFVAVAPFYIEFIAGEGQDSLRVVRIIRLARIARAFGSESMREYFGILAAEFKKTWRQSVTMVSMLVVLETCVMASLIYVAEGGFVFTGNQLAPDGCPLLAADQTACELVGLEDGTDHYPFMMASFCWWVEIDESQNCIPRYIREDGFPTPFISIPEAMYWVMSTMTTVGYGDIYPITVYGKIVAALTMLTGVLVVAVFIIVVGANFDQTTKIVRRLNYKREVAQKAEDEARKWDNVSPRAEGVPKRQRRGSASREVAPSAAPIQISQGPGVNENSENGSQSGALLITPAPGSEKGRPISE